METVRFSLISRQDLKIGTGTFEVVLADGKIETVDEIDIGALLEITPVKTYATTGLLPSPSLAGQLARVAADGFLYMSNGSSFSQITGTHTHVFGDVTSGTVAVANGGTGADFSATAQGAIWYFNGTGTIAALAAGTRGAFLEGKGAAANPVWLGPLTNGQLLIGSTSSDPVAASLTGANGITITNAAGSITVSGGRKTIRKTADESLDTSETLQNDDALLFAVAANEVWHFEFVLFLTSTSSTPDFKCTFTKPTGASGRWGMLAISSNSTSVVAATDMAGASVDLDGATTLACGVVANLVNMVILQGTIVNGANAGTLQLQWAQNTSNATAITVKTNSYGVAVLSA